MEALSDGLLIKIILNDLLKPRFSALLRRDGRGLQMKNKNKNRQGQQNSKVTIKTAV